MADNIECQEPLRIYACDCDITWPGFPADTEVTVSIYDPVNDQTIEQEATTDEEGNLVALLPKTHVQIDLNRSYTVTLTWQTTSEGEEPVTTDHTAYRYFYVVPKKEELIPNCPEEE